MTKSNPNKLRFTERCIRHPVLAIVISALILVLGLRSVFLLPIQQYPSIQSAVIQVSTLFVGADPETMAAFVTTPIENAISQVNGIDYMTSSSAQNTSVILANVVLDYDADKVLTETSAQVTGIINQLPTGTQYPKLSITIGESISSMYIGFYSDVLPSNKINDYMLRVVQPQLQAVQGVQQASILGNLQISLRIWLDPRKLAGYGLSADQVANKIRNNNFVAGIGRTDGDSFVVDLTSNTDLKSVDEFKQMVIKASNHALIRLKDIAEISLGSQNYNTSVTFDNKSAVYIGIIVAPNANLLTVIGNVKKVFDQIQKKLPEGLNGRIVYDASQFVSSSIEEVNQSLIEAFIIVTAVVFVFLGSWRSLIIPIVAIPLSLVGTFFIMYALHYSLNLLTLLALVLAIGLVVDDAIIVVENVHRHMEEGKPPLAASIISAAELTQPIIAISVVLIAVYLPIGFMGGLTGALFTEFAFTLASSVAVSALVALSLSPMMCAKFLRPKDPNKPERFSNYIDQKFEGIISNYQTKLSDYLSKIPVILVFAGLIFASNYFLFISSKSELAPQEDQGIIMAQTTAGANASLKQTEVYTREIDKIFKSFKETGHTFQINGTSGSNNASSLNTAIGGMLLIPWDQRSRTSIDLQPLVQQMTNQIAGASIALFQPPPLPNGGSGLPIQFVIQTPNNFLELNEVLDDFLQKARESQKFIYLIPDLRYDKTQSRLILNRDKVAELGLDMKDIGNVLSVDLSQMYLNYFNYMGRSYQVIPQTERGFRLNASDLLNYYVTSSQGESIPLASFAKIENTVVPESINHFQQMNSATLSAIALPGVTMGEALETLRNIGNQVLPSGYTMDYAGQARQFMHEGSSLVTTFFFAMIVIFLALAVLFDSFRDPLVVLISVPLSTCGALIFVSLGFHHVSLNIYTEVGLITLIGLVAKHGILIVQFANDQQRLGKSKREAVEIAAATRFRPIIMTTAAMVLGVIPLLLANGAGASSRFNIGIVIAAGISIGTLFTLFVVPAMYVLLAKKLTD